MMAGLALVLVACGTATGTGQFEIHGVEAHWSNGRVRGSCELGLKFSPEAREALGHGVALTVELELILRSTADQTRVGNETLRYEIRYLPLSEHYQVTGLAAGHPATFRRLRHALAELSRLDFSIETGALPAGEYELLARSRLDHQRMPPPMRLPALFDPGWKHASGWSSWDLAVDPAG
jgi:hypothetical protein